MAKRFSVEVEVPKGCKAGDTFVVEVEAPSKPTFRGQLAGIALEDMTDEQLKRELINSNSVLYKARQRGAAEATINANAERVAKAMLEKGKRAPAPKAAKEPVESPITEDIVMKEEVAAEL